jgi:hypothetical protein
VARQEFDDALADLGRVLRWHQGSERERTPGDDRLRGAILLRQDRYPNALRHFDVTFEPGAGGAVPLPSVEPSLWELGVLLLDEGATVLVGLLPNLTADRSESDAG